MSTSAVIHIILHALVPALMAYFFWPENKWRAFAVLIATMAVDLDHLLADPIYSPERCSIGFHPLHHPVMIVLYGLMTLNKKMRLAGVGLLIHMFLDFTDCL